jgi:CheY-like chemotaxis protein
VKVLIAEDEPLFLKILSQLLCPEFELTVTEDGTTALAGLQEEAGPVLAILDWLMPGLTGIGGMPGTTSPPANCRHLRDCAHGTKQRC